MGNLTTAGGDISLIIARERGAYILTTSVSFDWTVADDMFFSHPLDKNIPFYRCLRFFYPGLLSQPRL